MKKRVFWIHGANDTSAITHASKLRAMGIAAIVLRDTRHVDEFLKEGLEIWIEMACFRFNPYQDDESVLCTDITGRRVNWGNTGCPCNPVLRERDIESVKTLCNQHKIKGIIIDKCRFASPIAGLNAFLTCFDEHCRNKAKEANFNIDQIQRDVRYVYQILKGKKHIKEQRGLMWFKGPAGVVEWLMDHTGLLEWLRFRRFCITEHFRTLAEIIHKAGLRVGIYAYTPSLAPLVGQSYVDLDETTDVFCPLIFRKWSQKPGEGCLAWEITAIADELGIAGSSMESLVVSVLLSWARMTGPVTERTINGLRVNGISPEAAAREVILARSLINRNKELLPVVLLDDPLLGETAHLMFANTANGMLFFTFRDNWEKLLSRLLKE